MGGTHGENGKYIQHFSVKNSKEETAWHDLGVDGRNGFVGMDWIQLA
jgi:hypothetical protein